MTVIDRKWKSAALWSMVGSLFAAMGLIHVPEAGFKNFSEPTPEQCDAKQTWYGFGSLLGICPTVDVHGCLHHSCWYLRINLSSPKSLVFRIAFRTRLTMRLTSPLTIGLKIPPWIRESSKNPALTVRSRKKRSVLSTVKRVKDSRSRSRWKLMPNHGYMCGG